MAFKCARVGGDLGSVLVLNDAKVERVSFANASGSQIFRIAIRGSQLQFRESKFGLYL